MQLIYQGGRFVFKGLYEYRYIPKNAGFQWDGFYRVWYTTDPEKAHKISQDERVVVKADVLEAIEKEREKKRAAIQKSMAGSADISVPAPAGLDYLPYQRAGIAYAMERPGTLIADEMGLGKTIQAIGVVNADPGARSVLVVAPAMLKINWKREFERWDTKGLSVGIADTKGLPTTDVVIINYEQAKKFHAALRARSWDVLIADEAHYLKNPKAQRTKEILGERANGDGIRARRRIFLTGTPILNRPIELWPLLRSLDPNGLGKGWVEYVKRYCDGRLGEYGWEVNGASNLDELQDRLRSTIMVRRLKKDVLTELPDKRRSIIVIPSDGDIKKAVAEERKLVDSYKKEIKRLDAEARKAKAAGDDALYKRVVEELRTAQLQSIDEMARARHNTALAKAPAVVEWIRDAGLDKLVVMAYHKDVAEKIASEFGDEAVLVHGEKSQQERQRAVDRFQSDKSCKLFVGTIKAAGVGITLTAASDIVFAELDWTPGSMNQAEDRVHRIGQKNSVTVTHIVADGSLDADIAKKLVEKQQIITQSLDRPDQMYLDLLGVGNPKPEVGGVGGKERPGQPARQPEPVGIDL